MNKKAELNQLVMEYQADKAAGKRTNNAISNKLYTIAMELTSSQKRSPYYESAFNVALMNSLKEYNSSKGDFINFFSRALSNQIKDELKADKKHNSDLRLDDDSNETDIYEKIEGENMEKYENNFCLLELMLGVVRTRQNKFMNSPKICWDTYFFTEDIACSSATDEYAFLHIQSNSERYLSTISLDFINSYTTSECRTIEDIKKAKLKPEDVFLGNGKSKPCGYKLIDAVYAQYFNVTTSAVVQQRGHYHSRIKENFNKT